MRLSADRFKGYMHAVERVLHAPLPKRGFITRVM
jgi:hypothetical protein